MQWNEVTAASFYAWYQGRYMWSPLVTRTAVGCVDIGHGHARERVNSGGILCLVSCVADHDRYRCALADMGHGPASE